MTVSANGVAGFECWVFFPTLLGLGVGCSGPRANEGLREKSRLCKQSYSSL